MIITELKNQITQLFANTFNEATTTIEKLPSSGSARIYFRICSKSRTVIGAYNEDIEENEAFFSFTESFEKLGLKVPKIFSISSDRKFYIQSDLGNQTLYHSIWKGNEDGNEKTSLCHLKKSLSNLVQFQLKGKDSIDFTKCYPTSKFDGQAIQWDLNYFKYNFLKLAKVPFNEQLLENDFQTIIDNLSKVSSDYFMFRDFQSRNIMIIKDEPWFIDYQGGRMGPLQYDLASILYSPKTQLNDTKKELLLDFYIEQLQEEQNVDIDQFKSEYYNFVLIRVLQAMGAYGYRGLFEQKNSFIKSIPVAISNLNQLINSNKVLDLPELKRIIKHLATSHWANKFELNENTLTLRVCSFSYKNGIPMDPSENGGGFAFDCRGLPNPGRYKQYKHLNGTDTEVINYLQEYAQVFEFQKNAQNITKISIEEYIRRGFKHLCVNFGCTGGQHRSVYNAEKFAQWASNNFPVKVVLIHNEMNSWKRDE